MEILNVGGAGEPVAAPQAEAGAIILASASPRRRELLDAVGCEFEVITSDVDETLDPGVPPHDAVEVLARRKCEAVASLHPDRVVLAADTLVELDGAALGKPADAADAVRMLRNLSGRENIVHTGVAVSCGGRTVAAVETTRVKFRELSDAEIARYVASGEPLDKAGAYGIQRKGALLVERVDGDYFNVVGLPLVLSARLLGEFGIQLL